MERSYIAFISYKHTQRDAAIAKQVHTLIENYIIPKALRKDGKKLGIVFRDEEELPISSDLTDSICTALDASRYLIVICSREAKQSPWVAREVNYFLQHHDASNAFVVLADGEPNEVFPYELTHLLNEETGEYQEVEPLAMDVRADSISASLKKAKTNIKKLYAGMLGCSYDSLVQREKTRKMKRVAALAALIVLLAGCFVGMLIVKNRELSQKNDELTAAIELALNRESQLLVEEADEALQNGEVVTAIQYAVDALHSDDIERPYYAPAERVLFSVVDVLGNGADTSVLSKVALKHRAPVQMMAAGHEGNIIYTIDIYGTVSGFNSATGDLLWNVKLKENPKAFLTKVEPQVWYDAANDIVICHYDNAVTGLDALKGEISWQTFFENSVVSGLFFEPGEQKLACIERANIFAEDSESKDYNEFRFKAFSTQDGSLLHEIPVQKVWMDDVNSIEFGGYADDCSSGMFAGPERFVGTLFKEEQDIKKALLYIVDLSENTVSFIENEAFAPDSGYIKTFYIGNDRAFVLNNKDGLSIQCFELNAGKMLWENTAVQEKYISTYDNCLLIANKAFSVIAVGKNMHVVDNDTGEVQAWTELFDDILDLYWVQDGLFGFTLANGYCDIGWKNSQYGLISSGYSVDLPDTSKVLTYNGGLVQAKTTDGQIDEFFSLPLQDGGGSVTYLSEDKCIAYVASILPKPVLPEPISVESQDSVSSNSGEFMDVNRNGTVLMGLSRLADGKGMTIVDTENHTFKTILLDEDAATFSNTFYLTEDNQNIIACNPYGVIRRIGIDGSDEIIAESDSITIFKSEEMEYTTSRCKAAAARQSSDGRIIAASCDGEQISFWTDGKDEAVVQIPDDVRWAVIDGLTMPRLFSVGQNGLVLLSNYASDTSTAMDNFTVYSLPDKEWKRIVDLAHGTAGRLIAAGQCSPVFAVYDEDMNIRIYDFKTAGLASCIPAGLPMVSVMRIGMLFDDQYIYVLTRDGQFMLYAMETGEMVYRTLFSNVYSGEDFSGWLDRTNNRMYMRTDTDAICVDLQTWEQLFCDDSNVNEFVFYSMDQNEVYMRRYDYQTETYSLSAIPIPTTDELIDIARETLP